MGSIIHSHGVHFFGLAGPDLLLGIDSDPAVRNIVGLMQSHPEVATKALRVRSLGALITELIGGRGTHPVSLVGGGVSAPLTKEKREALIKFTGECLELGLFLLGVAKGALTSQLELVTSLPMETYYMGTVAPDGALDLYQGELRLRSHDGSYQKQFSEDDWAKEIYEETVAHSYAKYVFCNTDHGPVPYRVGPLARLNVADKMATPLAQQELEAFREIGGHPCNHTVMYHYARLVELVYAIENLKACVEDDEIISDNVRTKATNTPRSATAHVEAQRGVLIHDYQVDSEGIVERANLIVATQQNISAINKTIEQSVRNYINSSDAMLLNGIEFGIRCYDPCLSCATHRIGEMKLDVQIRKNGELIRHARRN